MRSKIAVIDTETIRWSDEVIGGFDNLEAFGLSLLVIGILDEDQKLDFEIYSPYAFAGIPNFPDLGFVNEDQVRSRLGSADRIVSFNGENFDFHILKSAGFNVRLWWERSFDLLAHFRRSTGHRIGLDHLAKVQFGDQKKFTSPEQAVKFWRAGLELLRGWSGSSDLDQKFSDRFCARTAKFLFEQVIEYCKHDVRLTYQLYKYVQKHKRLDYFDRSGKIRKFCTIDC